MDRGGPVQENMMMKYLEVDAPFTYNMIRDILVLNQFEAIVSTYHMKMKFSIIACVNEVSCDLENIRKCYNLSLKMKKKIKKSV